jgi:hypothetical protein
MIAAFYRALRPRPLAALFGASESMKDREHLRLKRRQQMTTRVFVAGTVCGILIIFLLWVLAIVAWS